MYPIIENNSLFTPYPLHPKPYPYEPDNRQPQPNALAAKIRARTNDTRDILDLLHEIAQGEHDATEHDKLNATGILFDRGYGKTPLSRHLSASTLLPKPTTTNEAAIHESPPETDDSDVGALREAPAG